MFTDIVGYTALMGESEDKAYQLLKKNRRLQKPLIEKHGGKWLKEMGDGVLASFPTVTAAVYCAIEMQRACKDETDLKLRIGIHQGEVIVEDGDVFGDGVNIASRLEPLAPVGGIYVSESVFRNIENKEGVRAEYVREETLKNVKHPVRIYEVDVDTSEIRETGAKQGDEKKVQKYAWLKPAVLIFIIALSSVIAYLVFNKVKENETKTEVPEMQEREKSIAVLPFTNMTNDPDQEYFSEGMMLEILNHLVKIEDLHVTPRTSMIKYKGTTKTIREIAKELGVTNILEGSVRKSGNKARISVLLIDTKENKNLWAESYDRELIDVLSIQSEVAQQIAIYLKAEISPEVKKRIDKMPTENIHAYDLYLKASSFAYTPTLNNQESTGYLRKAIQLDSNFAKAYALLGSNIIFQAGFTQDENPKDVGQEAKVLLERALLLDPMDAEAHNMMANYLLWYEKDFNNAEINYRLGMELAPSYANSYQSFLDLLLSEGRFQEAIPISSKILEIAGNDLDNWGRDALLWAFIGDEKKMFRSIEKIKESNTNDILPYTESARAYLILKQYDQVLEILDLSDGIQQISRVKGLKSIAYYKTGDIENHNRELNALIQKSTETAGGSPSFYTAMVYGSKGNIDEAFKWLEKSFMDNELELYWLKVEPEFESLYNDPRWQEMLDKVGFPD